jgi:hypothetical protein
MVNFLRQRVVKAISFCKDNIKLYSPDSVRQKFNFDAFEGVKVVELINYHFHLCGANFILFPYHNSFKPIWDALFRFKQISSDG